jgi:hypothetical protein
VLGALGAPFDLGAVLARLDDRVTRVSPGVLEATTTLRELLPADVIEDIQTSIAEFKERAEAAAAQLEADTDAAGEGDDDDDDESLDIGDEIDDDFLDDPVVIRLAHAPDGRLDELTITTESGKGDDRSVDRETLTFSAWGEPAEIDLPAPSDLDLTPGIEEEDIGAFRSFPLLAPRVPPDGFVLQDASVEQEDTETETCESVALLYGPRLGPEDDGLGGTRPPFLEVTLKSPSCEWLDEGIRYYGDEGPAEPLPVGAYQAELFRSEEDGSFLGRTGALHVRLTVGQTLIDAYSNLPVDQMVAALASLGPLDLAGQPIDRHSPPPGN